MRTSFQKSLNKAEQDLLDSFISDTGSHFETILFYDAIDIGTKCIYLKKAISEDCATFLDSLDRLYCTQAEMIHDARQMEFITALKFINDICFNNDVLYEDFGTRSAITHYFSFRRSLDEISSPVSFKKTVECMTFERIAELEELISKDELRSQIVERGWIESAEHFSKQWRSRLNLPPSLHNTPRTDRRSVIVNALRQHHAFDDEGVSYDDEITLESLQQQGIKISEILILETLYFLVIFLDVPLPLAIDELSNLSAAQALSLRDGYSSGLRQRHLRALPHHFSEHTQAMRFLLKEMELQPEVTVQMLQDLNVYQIATLNALYADGLRPNQLKIFGNRFSVSHKNALIFFIKTKQYPVKNIISYTFLMNAENIDLLHQDYFAMHEKYDIVLRHFMLTEKFGLKRSLQSACRLNNEMRINIERLYNPHLNLSKTQIKKFPNGLSEPQATALFHLLNEVNTRAFPADAMIDLVIKHNNEDIAIFARHFCALSFKKQEYLWKTLTLNKKQLSTVINLAKKLKNVPEDLLLILETQSQLSNDRIITLITHHDPIRIYHRMHEEQKSIKNENAFIKAKIAIDDIMQNYIHSRTTQSVLRNTKNNFDPAFFKGIHRNNTKTMNKLNNADFLRFDLAFCKNTNDLKSLVSKCIVENNLFEKDAWHFFTKSQYGAALKSCENMLSTLSVI